MVKQFSYTIALLLLAACGNDRMLEAAVDTVRVNVPVAQARAVPPQLREPVLTKAMLPAFVPVGTVGATSALTPEGEAKLQALIATLMQRIAAWEAYAQQ